MKTYYIGGQDGNPRGPYSLKELRIMASQNEIGAETLVIKEGENAWGKYAELFSAERTQEVVSDLTNKTPKNENDQTYMIDVGGKVSGPHSIADLIRLREENLLPDTTEIIYSGGSWGQATELLSNSRLLTKLGQQCQSSNLGITLPLLAVDHSRVVGRYKDAYQVGGAILALGAVIQLIGGIIAGLMFMVSLLLGNTSLGAGGFFVGLILTVAIGGVAWILGVIVKAQGQILHASLDTAVANSPFLTNPERAEAMGLPR